MRLLTLLLALASALAAQVLTGSISGSITDSTGAVIPSVQLKLVHEATGAARDALTDGRGNFAFSAVAPGAYTLTVEHPGFKRYERNQVVLPANERLALEPIRLELGGLTETISVTAQGATVQAASAERSGIISASQIQNLTVVSRDFSALVALLPGVVANARGETPGFAGTATFNIQGLRQTGNNVTVDGIPTSDLGNATDVTAFSTMDSVGELKVLVSNYQAEFGRKPGASIQAVTKSGSREFHGALYWYKRHEQFNANNFFNNRQGIPEPPYRYTSAGFNVGGPILLPFQRNRSKLFFFFSNEYLREARPQPIRQTTMPTADERRGDFRNSLEVNGSLIVIRDPLAGQPFPSNIVPASRIQSNGQRYLALFPDANFFDVALSGRRYNHQFQESLIAPKHTETVRIDSNWWSKTQLYGRFNNWWEDIRGAAAPGGNSNWGLLPNSYRNTSRSGALSATHIFGPSLILEASMGVHRATEAALPLRQSDVDRLNRRNASITIPQFYPQNNPLNLIPQSSFGGVSNGVAATFENRFPLRGTDTLFIWNASLSKTRGAHVLKAGLTAERTRNFEGNDGVFTGTFNFGRDVNNPGDSNHPFANALLGNFASYSESTTRPWVQIRSTILETFLQDNWKVHRKLTLDLGLRFTWAQPYHHYRREEAGFLPSRFDSARRVRLIEPFRSGNTRVGRNPVTGETFPAAAIGAIAPGSGDPVNGSVQTLREAGYPAGLRENSGLKAAPRIGFAYDPFGTGKTAIRGGFGLFFESREQGTRTLGFWRNPPLRADPVIYYGNLDTFINSSGVTFPSATTGLLPEYPLARVMNFSFGIQRNAGFGTVVDASYAATLGRHLLQGRNLNAIPFGANFAAANQDSTSPGRPLPAAFLRPYIGYNDIVMYEYASNSSYHSLQLTANRRFSRTLQYGVSWTWSKAMDYVDTNTAQVSNLVNPKVWNYGKAGFDRTHVMTIYWMWDLPAGSRAWNHWLARAAADHWQLSGIASFSSGAPGGIGLGFVQSVDTTGSPTDGARVVVARNPILAKDQRTFSRNFNTDAFLPAAVGTFGNAAKDVIRGPGINNWDISLFKNFPVRGDVRKLQFRAEFYNAFNHTQFSSLDTTTRFDAQGRQANARLGEFTSARAARRIQLALRFDF